MEPLSRHTMEFFGQLFILGLGGVLVMLLFVLVFGVVKMMYDEMTGRWDG